MEGYKFKKLFWASLIVAAIATIGFLIWRGTITGVQKPQFRTKILKKGDLAQTVSANGTLNPVILVNVGTQISGEVEKIYADFNDHVEAGQVLLELDKKLLNAALQQSLAQVNKAKANIVLARANEKRGTSLTKSGYISTQDYDQLVQLRKMAEADLDVAKAQLIKEQTSLSYATIRSPVSGVVVDREVDVGQTVAASFQTPVLFKIAQDLGKMQIDTSFAEADIGNIRPGQHVNFSVDAFPDRDFSGIVKQIRLNPTTEQNVVTYDVVVLVENRDKSLLPGMTAYVNVKTAEYKDVLLIPNAAFRFHPKNQKVEKGAKTEGNVGVVHKVQNGKLIAIRCHKRASNNKFTIVTSTSLEPGDEVVVGESFDQETSSSDKSFRFRIFR